MRSHSLNLAAVGCVLSSVAMADSTSNYRTAFIAHCTDGDRDPQTTQMCSCAWNEWESGLASKTDPAAVNAAKLMSNTKVDLYPSEMMAASKVAGDIGGLSMKCADSVMGKISVGGYDVDDGYVEKSNNLPTQDTAVIPQVPAQEASGKKRGLLGAVTGWAGRKAGLGDDLSEMAADKVDENEPSIRDRFNPFKRNKNKEESAE